MALGLVASAMPRARAEDPPPAVVALDSADAAAARAALLARPDAGDLIAATLRDAEAFDALSPAAKEAVLDLANEVDASRLNAGLRRVLRDDTQSADIRRQAVVALGTRGSVADVAVLEGALDEFAAEAAMALGQIGGRSAAAALRRHAGPDAHPAVLAALGRFGDDDALRSLVAQFGDDETRATWIGGLLSWATGRNLPPERAAWEAHLRRRALVRRIADEDIAAAGSAVRELTAALTSGTPATLEPDLVAILGEADWAGEARNAAALILGRGHARGARDALLSACKNGEDGSLRLYAAEALSFVGDLSVAVPFADMLVHDEDLDRIKARRTSTGEFFPVDPGMARTLFRLGCPGAADPLLEILTGEYRTRMHRDSMRALREISGGRDFDFEPDSAKPQREAAAAAARAWWDEARDGIGVTPRPDDPGWDAFRNDVAERIKGLGAKKFLYQLRTKKALVIVAEPALPQILTALGNADLHIRMGAAEVLALARLRAAAPLLAARLAVEENPAARSKLIVALEACGRPKPGAAPDPRLAEPVRALLGDRAIDVRIAAVHALGVLGDRTRDAAALQKALGHPIVALRVAAAGALLLLGDRAGLDALCDELLCDDVARRAASADVLRRAGVDLHDYDPDAAPDARETAVALIRGVSPGER